eukprot:CAMPEP_0172794174 /NCGR_PEP_ID=MMETSP1074-20121228/209846_1 /TAXON_ID=2916 /ORGANISM="Ceratium fusus, Strain PA161109" /LENGTH=114 /DNA_ID=CAMNT_0013631251 /DNA_START=820 /DNA_END=1164 /DNA_ORIENTATION=-
MTTTCKQNLPEAQISGCSIKPRCGHSTKGQGPRWVSVLPMFIPDPAHEASELKKAPPRPCSKRSNQKQQSKIPAQPFIEGRPDNSQPQVTLQRLHTKEKFAVLPLLCTQQIHAL